MIDKTVIAAQLKDVLVVRLSEERSDWLEEHGDNTVSNVMFKRLYVQDLLLLKNLNSILKNDDRPTI